MDKPMNAFETQMAVRARMDDYLERSFRRFLDSDPWLLEKAAGDLRDAIETYRLICESAEKHLPDHRLVRRRLEEALADASL